jgi:NitT/TauT family transport system permease protein
MTVTRASFTDRLRNYAPTIIVFFLGIILWQAVVTVFNIEGFLLPKPTVIAQKFAEQYDAILPTAIYTMRNAVGGFLIGSALGVLMAFATARWRSISEGVMPFAIAVNATPIVALAPIMNQWFGITNPLAKMSIVAVIVFFPVMINMVKGLTQVDENSLELMQSYAAKPMTVLTQLRLPNALPYLFSALKVSSTLSVIGSIVSEYFGGTREALGVYISQKAALFQFGDAWAAIIVACVMGIAFYLVLLLLEKWIMPWHASMRSAE